MEDIENVGAPTEAADATTAPETAPAAVPEQTAAPDWSTAVDTAPVDELRRHPRFAGMLGSEIEQRQKAFEAKITAQQTAKAQEEAQAEMLRLAREEPDVFADRYLAQAEQQRIADQMAGIEKTAQDKVIKKVGAAFNDEKRFPEWVTLRTDPKAQEQLARALQGVSDDDAIAVFNATALELMLERRAETRTQAKYDAQIAKEREAMRAELIAEMNRSGAAPGLARANGVPSADVLDRLPAGSKEWTEAYERRYGIR